MTEKQKRTAAGLGVIGILIWFFYVPPGKVTVDLNFNPGDWKSNLEEYSPEGNPD